LSIRGLTTAEMRGAVSTGAGGMAAGAAVPEAGAVAVAGPAGAAEESGARYWLSRDVSWGTERGLAATAESAGPGRKEKGSPSPLFSFPMSRKSKTKRATKMPMKICLWDVE